MSALGKYVNPFTDFGFKRLFGEEAHKGLLQDFLNELLPITDKITEITFKSPEQMGDTAKDRRAVYDIYCTTQTGAFFIVEMQKAFQAYFKDRTIFYTTFPIRAQAKKGKWDYKLSTVYCVAILAFEFSQEDVLTTEEEIFEGDYLHEVGNMVSQYADWFTAEDIKEASELKPGEGAIISSGMKKIAAFRDEQNSLHTCTAVCPHLGAILQWNADEKTFDCPMHGSRFTTEGKVINGPASTDLKKHKIKEEQSV